jgi:micrococcal nuclease
MGLCVTKNDDNKVDDNKIDLFSATMENTPEFTLKGHSCNGKIVEVYDGDTITVAFDFGGAIYRKRCRVDGVDCAEIRTKNSEEKKFGLETKEYVTNLILNKIVWVEFNEKKNDKYNRLLGKIFLEKGGETLDKILIRCGMGYEYHGGKKKAFSEWKQS